MRYVILGSNSFSGSHLMDELLSNQDNSVYGISRSPEKSALYLPYKARADRGNYEFRQCNIVHEFEKLVRMLDVIQPECIINYAALTEVYQSHQTPVEYFETNTMAMVKLCHELSLGTQHLRQKYLKCYIHISSAEVYGSCEKPVDESTPPHPTTPYAVSKATADDYLTTLFKHSGFPVIIIRSTNVYGKHQQLYKIIPRTVIKLMQGKKIELHDGGNFVRPFIHVTDAARGVIAAIERGKPGNIYNFSTECNLSIEEVVKLICQKMGKDFESSTVSVEERTGHDRRYWLDYSKANKKLAWYPFIPFERGLDEVISWIEDNWEEVLKEPQSYIHKV